MSKKAVEKKVMVFGTFDGVHAGHLNFLIQARKLGDFLVVSIGRDNNVKKIKGRRPANSEKVRLQLIKDTKLADKVVLGGQASHLPHIIREKPQIIGLGYDQSAYVKDLKKSLAARGIKVKVIRLKPYKQHKYKNSLLKKIKN